jgi:hypothetical protein
MATLEIRVERQQTSPRGAVMAGAEGERGLDLDADAVARNAGAVVRSMDQKAAGRDRLEPRKARRDPVARRHRLDDEFAHRLRARNGADEIAQRRLVRRLRKMRLHAPGAVRPLECRDRRVRADLGQRVGEPSRGRAVAIHTRQARDGRISG